MRALALVALVAFVACTSAPARKTGGRATENEPYEFEKEGKIPPLAESEIRRAPDFEEIAVTPDEVEAEEMTPPPVVVDTATVDSTVTGADAGSAVGYRVQIFATESAEAAERTRQEVAFKTKRKAYVERDGMVYKVRVGNCASRPQAEALQRICRAIGYPDAWIVKGPIEPPKAEPASSE